MRKSLKKLNCGGKLPKNVRVEAMGNKYTKKNKGITLIKKSNQLIEARYKFDIWETRMFLSVLANINKDDEDFRPYRIWYSDVIKTFGLRSNQSYDLLRNAARDLMRKVFKVSNQENGFQRETEYHIIRSVNYLAEGEEGKKGADSQEYIDITIDPEMRPLLLQLQKNFTAYDLRNVARLGVYHLRVYELLKQYEAIGERALRFDEMKQMMELVDEYPYFGNFYQRIIAPAVEDINQNTDIAILEVRKIREGRKYIGLHFSFRSKTREEMDTLRGILPQGSLFEGETDRLEGGVRPEKLQEVVEDKDGLFLELSPQVVQSWGMSPLAFAGLIETYSAEKIRQAVRVTERARRQNKAGNPAGFFVEAVKRGYTDALEARRQQQSARARRAAALETLQLEFEKNLNRRIRELTIQDERITRQAIADVCQVPQYQVRLAAIGTDASDVEAFRRDEELRMAVMNAIIAGNRDKFQDLIDAFEEAKRGLGDGHPAK